MAANYVERVVDQLTEELDDCDEDLLRLYALLVLVKGQDCTEEDVHNAWSLWRAMSNPTHSALIPFNQLSATTQALDTPYAEAIRVVAKAGAA